MAGFLVLIALGTQPSEAQYTANFQTNIISGVTSNWSGTYFVGNATFADALLIENGGVFGDGGATVGSAVSASNNSVLVTGDGSLWTNAAFAILFIGNSGAGSSLVVSDGGRVANWVGVVGEGATSGNNHVLVTDPSSVWSNINRLYFGVSGAGNSLVIRNGGQVLVMQDGVIVGENTGSSSNSVLVSDSGSVWNDHSSFTVGQNGNNNSLVISNGGEVVNTDGYVGAGPGGGGGGMNSVLVTGAGSVWSNSGTLSVGTAKGTGNGLVIMDGGQVVSSYGLVGGIPGGNNVLISGTGSAWSNRNDLYIGSANGADNSLVISNGAQVVDNACYVGDFGISSNNSVRVVGGGVWQNNSLYVGYQGSSNLLEVAGGSVFATNVIVGFASSVCNNILQLDSGNVIVTNGTGTGVLDVRYGKLILNGGVLQADTLVITNPCASFVHAGGTLMVSNVVLDPNTFRITSITPQGNDMLITWMMGPGASNTLQATAGDASGGYGTNGFADVFVVTNNTTIGTVTNYLDIGAATNTSSRYYRARLVP